MSVVTVRDFKFGDISMRLRFTIDVSDQSVWFVANDIAAALKFKNTKQAIVYHVDVKHKAIIKLPDEAPNDIHPQTMLINKLGVIQLIMKSKLPYAAELQEWLLEVVVPQALATAASPSSDADSQTVALLNDISTNMLALKRDNEELKQALISKNETLHQLATVKDKQIDRLLFDMTRYRDLLQEKDEQVAKLTEDVVNLAESAVEYPKNEMKQPYLCISKDGTTFTAITGQKKWLDVQKQRLDIDDTTILVERKRPNPQIDWTNIVDCMCETFDMRTVKRAKREIEFESDEDAGKFEDSIKRRFMNKLRLRPVVILNKISSCKTYIQILFITMINIRSNRNTHAHKIISQLH